MNIIIPILLLLLRGTIAVYNIAPPLQSSFSASAALSGPQGVALQRQHSPRLPGIRSREPTVGPSQNLIGLRSPVNHPLGFRGPSGQPLLPRPSPGTGRQRQPPGPIPGFTGQPLFPRPAPGTGGQRQPPRFPPQLPQRRPQTPPILDGQILSHQSPNTLLNQPQRRPQTPPILDGQILSHQSPNTLFNQAEAPAHGSGEGVPLPLFGPSGSSRQHQPPQQTPRNTLVKQGQITSHQSPNRLANQPRTSAQGSGNGVPLPLLTSSENSQQHQPPQETPRNPFINQGQITSHRSPNRLANKPRTSAQGSGNGVPLPIRSARPGQGINEHPNAVVNGVFLPGLSGPGLHGTPVQALVQSLPPVRRTFSINLASKNADGASCQAVTLFENKKPEATKTLYKNVFIPLGNLRRQSTITSTVLSTIQVTSFITETRAHTQTLTKTKLVEPSVVAVTRTVTAQPRTVTSTRTTVSTAHHTETMCYQLPSSRLSSGGVPLSLETGGVRDNIFPGGVRETISRGTPRGSVRFHLTDDEYNYPTDLGFAKSQPAQGSSRPLDTEKHSSSEESFKNSQFDGGSFIVFGDQKHSGNNQPTGDSSRLFVDEEHPGNRNGDKEEHSNEFSSLENDSNVDDYSYEDQDIITPVDRETKIINADPPSRNAIRKEGSQRVLNNLENSIKEINKSGRNLQGRNESEKVKVTIRDNDNFESFDSFLEFLKSNDEVFIFEDGVQENIQNKINKDEYINMENSSELSEENFRLLSHIKISQDTSSNSVKVSTIE